MNEGEACIVASSMEVTKLQAMHEKCLAKIKEAKQVRLNKLDEEFRLAIRQITKDFDEERKRQQEEAEARLVALQERTEIESADEERKLAESKAALRQSHIQELSSYKADMKDIIDFAGDISDDEIEGLRAFIDVSSRLHHCYAKGSSDSQSELSELAVRHGFSYNMVHSQVVYSHRVRNRDEFRWLFSCHDEFD